MKSFKDFGIKSSPQNFVGDKIKIDRILNRQIVVHDYKVEDSKFKKGYDKCLYMQITLEETKYVVFIGSRSLVEMIEQVPKENFPFTATIVRENQRFEFT
jgi:hypothetical protein